MKKVVFSNVDFCAIIISGWFGSSAGLNHDSTSLWRRRHIAIYCE